MTTIHHHHDEGYSFARGLLNGLALSAVLWVLIILAIIGLS